MGAASEYPKGFGSYVLLQPFAKGGDLPFEHREHPAVPSLDQLGGLAHKSDIDEQHADTVSIVDVGVAPLLSQARGRLVCNHGDRATSLGRFVQPLCARRADVDPGRGLLHVVRNGERGIVDVREPATKRELLFIKERIREHPQEDPLGVL